MLFFTQKRYQEALREGRKTIEIRAGSRYAKLEVGRLISINGLFKMRVIRIDRHESAAEFLSENADNYGVCGFNSFDEMQSAVAGLYGDSVKPVFAFHVRLLAKNPQSLLPL